MRIEMPWKVYVSSPNGIVTRLKTGKLVRRIPRYFSTKEEAIKFCGNEKLVTYSPGEAHKNI